MSEKERASKTRKDHAVAGDDDLPPRASRRPSGEHLRRWVAANGNVARGAFVVRGHAIADRALTLERIDILADGTVNATYASGRTYEYLSLEEVLSSHGLSLMHLERIR
jgi:hypothetical protein